MYEFTHHENKGYVMCDAAMSLSGYSVQLFSVVSKGTNSIARSLAASTIIDRF